jgi:hypothetical protein
MTLATKPTTPAPPIIWLRRQAVAAELTERGFPIKAATLAFKASRGGGPPFRRFGNKVFYDLTEALAWARAQTVDVTPKP